MEFEEIWQKIKRMNHREREMLASEMQQKGYNVGYIHPHYYFDAKAVHDILFYPPHQQHEIEDKDNEYYQALKKLLENDQNIHICFKRPKLLPRFINDYRESKIVREYICARHNEDIVNAWYRRLKSNNLDGGHPRSLFITKSNGSEVVYKMIGCKEDKGRLLLNFQKMG